MNDQNVARMEAQRLAPEPEVEGLEQILDVTITVPILGALAAIDVVVEVYEGGDWLVDKAWLAGLAYPDEPDFADPKAIKGLIKLSSDEVSNAYSLQIDQAVRAEIEAQAEAQAEWEDDR